MNFIPILHDLHETRILGIAASVIYRKWDIYSAASTPTSLDLPSHSAKCIFVSPGSELRLDRIKFCAQGSCGHFGSNGRAPAAATCCCRCSRMVECCFCPESNGVSYIKPPVTFGAGEDPHGSACSVVSNVTVPILSSRWMLIVLSRCNLRLFRLHQVSVVKPVNDVPLGRPPYISHL